MCGAGNTAIGKILWAARATRGGTERTCEQQLQGGVAGEAIPKGAGGGISERRRRYQVGYGLGTGYQETLPCVSGPAEPGDYTNRPQEEAE